MTEREKPDRRDFTPEEAALLQADADEAERGYDLDDLLARRRGGRKPSVGRTAAVVVPVRLDPARLAALDTHASRLRKSRSQVIRDAIDHELSTSRSAQ